MTGAELDAFVVKTYGEAVLRKSMNSRYEAAQ